MTHNILIFLRDTLVGLVVLVTMAVIGMATLWLTLLLGNLARILGRRWPRRIVVPQRLRDAAGVCMTILLVVFMCWVAGVGVWEKVIG